MRGEGRVVSVLVSLLLVSGTISETDLRKVKMRIHCDSCEKNLATVMCCADEAALCTDCDALIHAANKLSNKHVRVSLLAAPEPAKCDICQVRSHLLLLCHSCFAPAILATS